MDANEKRNTSRKNGRPRTAEQIEQLILKLAKDNSWGYCRILGELRKLGVMSVTRNTVKNILKRNGYETGPARGPGTWDEFLKRHAKTMWQCDFFSKKIVSKTGLRDIFVLVFLNVKTRQVYITPSTYKPDQAWMIEQAEVFIKHTQEQKLLCKIVMHDNDGKDSKPFLDVFKKAKIKSHRTAIRSPNTVAYVERFIQTIQQECLDHFVVFGHKHMDVLCRAFNDHYHQERPHQGLDNELIKKPTKNDRQKSHAKPDTIRLSDIRCEERLGGLLKSYSREAAYPYSIELSKSVALSLKLAEIVLSADRTFLLSMSALQCTDDERMRIGPTSSIQKPPTFDNKSAERGFCTGRSVYIP